MNALALVCSGLLLLAAAALRAASASLVRTPRADALHDAAEGDRGAQRVAELLDRRERIQPAVGVVHSGLMVTAALPAAWAISTLAAGWREAVALLVLGVAMVVAGDLLPRSYGRSHPRRLAYRLAPLLARAAALGSRAADLLSEEPGEPIEGNGEPEHDEQDQEELELISSVLEFSETIVREVMVPRTDMVTVTRRATTDDVLDVILRRGYSRLPVEGESLDDVVGVVFAKDLLRIMDRGEPAQPVEAVMRPIDFVPETKRVSDLLRQMQASKGHMAVVVDEFGGTAGLVTLEDVLEQLVGEVQDEFDTETPRFRPEPSGSWLIDGLAGVAALQERL
ncbi:MAG: hemolysin family protein, partial [Acidimicrobiia bacterium]